MIGKYPPLWLFIMSILSIVCAPPPLSVELAAEKEYFLKSLTLPDPQHLNTSEDIQFRREYAGDEENPVDVNIQAGFEPIKLPRNFVDFDLDGDMGIDVNELIAVTGAVENVYAAFNASDTDGNGKISEAEFYGGPLKFDVDITDDDQEIKKETYKEWSDNVDNADTGSRTIDGISVSNNDNDPNDIDKNFDSDETDDNETDEDFDENNVIDDITEEIDDGGSNGNVENEDSLDRDGQINHDDDLYSDEIEPSETNEADNLKNDFQNNTDRDDSMDEDKIGNEDNNEKDMTNGDVHNFDDNDKDDNTLISDDEKEDELDNVGSLNEHILIHNDDDHLKDGEDKEDDDKVHDSIGHYDRDDDLNDDIDINDDSENVKISR